MNMQRRGMTLLETLLTLTLLALLMAGAANWLHLTAAVRSDRHGPLAWSLAAESALQRIAEDVFLGDFDLHLRDRAERVQVHDGRLEVLQRTQGAARWVIWELDARSSDLHRTVRSHDEPGARRDVLTEVRNLEIELDRTGRMLKLMLTSHRGQVRTRRISLP